MKQTDNYQLNQWEMTDRVLMEDFNRDNQKLDAAIAAKGNCRIAVGSYTGTGEHGQEHPNKLTFDFEPILVIMDALHAYSTGFTMIWPRGTESRSYVGDSSIRILITWEGKTLSWYASNYRNDGSKPQMNQLDQVYHYIAIG